MKPPRRNEQRAIIRQKREQPAAIERDPLIYPIKGMTIAPDGLPLMLGAWLGLVEWLITQDWARAQFKDETGHDIVRVLGAKGLTAMVDKATGHDLAVVGAWADWVTTTQWGSLDQPMGIEA